MLLRNLDSILLGVDLAPGLDELTPGSSDALAQARWIAERNSARLTILHSTAADERWDEQQSAYVHVEPRDGDPALAALERHAEELRSHGIEVEVRTATEPAGVAIVQHTLRHSPDLAIVSKRSYDRKRRARMGGVALRLIRMCPVPLLVVAPHVQTEPRLVLACTDLTPTGDSAVQLGSEVAQRSHAEFHVLHAFQYSMEVQMSGEKARREWEQEYRAKAKQRIQALVEGDELRDPSQIHIGLTSPSRAIQESLERLEPDLLVMGSISRSGLSGLLIGNTAERVFATVDCTLLVVKPEDFHCPIELPG